MAIFYALKDYFVAMVLPEKNIGLPNNGVQSIGSPKLMRYFNKCVDHFLSDSEIAISCCHSHRHCLEPVLTKNSEMVL